MVRDVTEVIELLADVAKKENVYSVKKEEKKIEKKLNSYHVDYIQMCALDNLIQSYMESNEENKYENKKSMNRKRYKTCIIIQK